MSPWGLRESPRREHARRFCITEYTQMISVDQIPETIHLVFPDASGNDTMLVLQLKK